MFGFLRNSILCAFSNMYILRREECLEKFRLLDRSCIRNDHHGFARGILLFKKRADGYTIAIMAKFTNF